MYFPKNFKTNDEENYNILVVRQLQAECEKIIHNDGSKELEIFDIEKQMLNLRRPNVWNVYEEGNLEIVMEVEFEKFLIAISEFSNETPDNLMTFRFYAQVDYLTEKHKPKN